MVTITKEMIMKAVELARRFQIEPCVVKTRKEARKMTKIDLLGKRWKKGDKYYFAISELERQKEAIKDDHFFPLVTWKKYFILNGNRTQTVKKTFGFILNLKKIIKLFKKIRKSV